MLCITDDKPLPVVPIGGEDVVVVSPTYVLPFREPPSDSSRSHVTLMAQESDDFFYSTPDDESNYRGGLSPISERTELTEYSRDWPLPVAPPVTEDDRIAISSSASTVDYGEVIGALVFRVTK